MSAAWIAETLLASTLLIAAVMVVRGKVAALFGARIAYALWALPLLRLLLPPLPQAMRPAVEGIAVPIGLPIDLAVLADLPAYAPEPVARTAFAGWFVDVDWLSVILVVWLAGALFHFGWQIGLYRRFLRVALRGSALLCERCGIKVHVSATVAGPVAAGVLDRHILLPGDFTVRYTRREQRLVLAHEVAHHVRGDLIANFFALAMLSLHWFNPLAHFAYRAFRADQELACDETVLAEEPAGERHSYATALVKSAGGDMPAAACSLGAAHIKRRLRMMAAGKISRVRRLAGGALAILATGGGLVLTASGGMAAPDLAPRLAEIAPPAPVATVAIPASVAAPDALIAPVEPVARTAPVAGIAPMPVAPVAAPQDSAALQRDISGARREALMEAQAARETALREAAEARAEAGKARAEALAEAAAARTEVLRDAAAARAAAAQARANARSAVSARQISADVDRQVRLAMAQAAAQSERQCGTARSVSVSRDGGVDIAALAGTCADGSAIRAETVRGLRQARDQIRASVMSSAQRRHALAAIDHQIDQQDADFRTD